MEGKRVDAVVYDYSRIEASPEWIQIFVEYVVDLSALLSVESVGKILVVWIENIDNFVRVLLL